MIKKMFLIIVISFSFSATAFAEEKWWSAKDTAWEAAYATLHIADWGQTRYIAKNPRDFYEVNPLLGEHPSVGKVDTYFIGGLLAHAAVSYALPPKYRRIWQYVGIALEGGYVANNVSMGIKFGF